MTLLLITFLLVSGLGSLSSSVPRQFHVVKEQKNWTEAQQYCREEFTDLATIDNMTENEKVKSMIHDGGVSQAWIGLKQGSSPKWQWTLADRDFYRENETEFRNWGKKQPEEGDEYCVVQDEHRGLWHDYYCRKTFPFICYNGGNSTQPYVLVTEKKNWTDAQRYCRENHTDLASVRNQTENDQIDNVRGGGYNPAWIGLFRDAWEWSDVSSSSFRLWDFGEPNYDGIKNCAQVHTNGWWNKVECSDPGAFICYEDKLVLVRENKTWREALQYCREHHVDLVSVTSERVQRWVRERAKGASTAHVWLGLRHTCGLGIWSWVSGEMIWYNHWAPGQERVESCKHRAGAVESGGGQWVNLPETEKLNFICTTEAPKQVKRQMVRVEIQTDSQENVDDPSMQQAFLQQIQQRLRESGMPADAKLTWMRQPDGKIFQEKKTEKIRERDKI
ncbi:C-type mannose receptor 2-like [Alosa pseudoharengus]|uniref:C-type mannose receptor 2-like n=1 Tax=Alosa pseudoharengus TaxID=34774 RepID=UPI003F88DC08